MGAGVGKHVSRARTAVLAAATTQPAPSCPHQLPLTPVPRGSEHSQSGDRLYPWGPRSPLARPKPVFSAKGRDEGQKEGLGSG